MRIAALIPLSITLIAVSACDGGVDVTTGTPSGSGGSGTTGTAPDTSSASTGGGAGGGGGETVTITMDSFVVKHGTEVYKCQDFANPFGGQDADVTKFESHMTAGSHHMLLFYKPAATDGPIEDCSGLEFAATPYGTQVPDDSLTFPAGVAGLIPTSMGLRMQAHYLNTTGQDITAKVTTTFHVDKSGTISTFAGVLFVPNLKINVPPHAMGAVVSYPNAPGTCNIPFDMNFIRANSHMHQHGIKFDAAIDGAPVLDTTDWNEPKPVLFAPAMKVPAGSGLSFSCTYNNNTANALTFGESAATNEMCIFSAAYYPVPSPDAVTISCQ
jgi:hypothetical protein